MTRYIDINGKIALSMLKGNSGKTYGTIALYEPDELAEILADGISVYVAPEPAPPTPQKIERMRRNKIRGEAMKRVDSLIKATGNHEFSLTVKIIRRVITGGTIPPAFKTLMSNIEAIYDVRDAAITNGTLFEDVVWPTT